MPRIPLILRVVALLLVLTVTVPLAAAAAHQSSHRSDDSGFDAAAPIARLWSWLTAVWEKNGCMIDPNGRCLPGTGAAPAPPAGTDNGCALDTHGRCGS